MTAITFPRFTCCCLAFPFFLFTVASATQLKTLKPPYHSSNQKQVFSFCVSCLDGFPIIQELYAGMHTYLMNSVFYV